MDNGVKFEIEGLEDLQRKLKQLGDSKRTRNAARRALRRGANIVRQAAVNRAKALDDPNTEEKIWKNINVRGGGTKRERRVGGAMMRVGVLGGARNMEKYGEFRTGKSGKSNPGGDTWYWRMLEFGTSQMAAKPFMRNAMADSADAATSEIVKAINVELDKEIAKLNVP